MTTAQIARAFRAKRIRKGKYAAKCPIHNDHRPSLWIMEGRQGTTIFGCWSGCQKEAILAAVGLKFSDLFADSKPNKQKLREMERIRAEEERERRKAKDRLWRMADQMRAQRKIVRDLGKQAAWNPRDRLLCERFHFALEQYRILDQTVVYAMMKLHHFKEDYFVVGDL